MMLIQITSQPTDYIFIVFIFIYPRKYIQLFLAEMLPNANARGGGNLYSWPYELPPPSPGKLIQSLSQRKVKVELKDIN